MRRFYRRRALKALSAGKYEKAEGSYRALENAEPPEPDILRHLGLVLMAQRKYKEAERYLTEDLNRDGEIFERVAALADLYYVWEQRGEAQTFYRRAEALAENAEDRRLCALRREISGDEERFTAAAQGRICYQAGNEAMQRGDLEAAERDFRRAIELDPTNYQALNNLGAIAMNHQKDYDAAILIFERARSLSRDSAIAENLAKARALGMKRS